VTVWQVSLNQDKTGYSPLFFIMYLTENPCEQRNIERDTFGGWDNWETQNIAIWLDDDPILNPKFTALLDSKKALTPAAMKRVVKSVFSDFKTPDFEDEDGDPSNIRWKHLAYIAKSEREYRESKSLGKKEITQACEIAIPDDLPTKPAKQIKTYIEFDLFGKAISETVIIDVGLKRTTVKIKPGAIAGSQLGLF
jgi:hypothetical protein